MKKCRFHEIELKKMENVDNGLYKCPEYVCQKCLDESSKFDKENGK